MDAPVGSFSRSSLERRDSGARTKSEEKPSAASSIRPDRLGSVGKKDSGAALMPPVGRQARVSLEV